MMIFFVLIWNFRLNIDLKKYIQDTKIQNSINKFTFIIKLFYFFEIENKKVWKKLFIENLMKTFDQIENQFLLKKIKKKWENKKFI